MGNDNVKISLTGIKSIALPVEVAPLDRKYYGTIIMDANREEVVRLWTSKGAPSQREKEAFGDDWTPESWSEYCCDGHWECEVDLAMAEMLVELLNKAMIPTHKQMPLGGKTVNAVNRFSSNVFELLASVIRSEED